MPDSPSDALQSTMSTTAQHPASVGAYIRNGWALVAIPPGTKGPATKDWNQRVNCLKSSADLPSGWGIGLAHAYSGTMALDIDNWDRAALELATIGLNLDELYQAPDAVVIHSGRPGHGKLLYSMPFGLVLPSKKLTDLNPEGGRYNYLDFRCGTFNELTVQDVLPPSIHPDTQKPYAWEGRGHWTRLPQIPMGLLDYWRRLLERDNAKTIATPDHPTSFDELRDALRYIDPACGREEWIQIGMALHYAGTITGRLEDALALWDEWSGYAPSKYPGVRGMRQQWSSMRTDKATMVRVGTLFHYAKINGWVRPEPEVAHLFKPVNVVEVEQVITSFEVPPPSMDLDLWPDTLKGRALEIADQRGCDPLVPLFAGLAAVCGAVDARTRLELMPGFQVPPVLWLMTIGNPADKKSPGSRPMFTPLKTIEKEDRANFQRELLRWEGKQAAHDTAKKAFLQWSASPESLLDNAPPSVPELPDAPAPLKIIVNDITSQKLVREAALRPRGLLSHMDEMAAWVRKMSDKTSGEDRSSWVVSYEAEPYVMDRVGAGSIACDNLAVSIYGNIQPEVYRKALPDLALDGLVQRFIPAILRAEMTKKGNPMPDELTQSSTWENLLRLVYALPVMTYRLSGDAYVRFRAFQDWYENRKVDERVMQSSATYMTAFGKLEGTCGRLALVLHMIENPFNPEVQASTLERAIKIIQGYVMPALKYSLDGLGNGSPFLNYIVDWVACNADRTSVTLGFIRTSCRRMLDTLNPYQVNNAVINAFATLQDAGWVQRIDDGSMEHRHHAEWAINPRLLVQFAAYRKRREELRKQNTPAQFLRPVDDGARAATG